MTDLENRYKHYRQRLIEAMKARQLTNEELAARMNSHAVTVSKLRNGTLNLNDKWRDETARAIGLDHDILYGDAPMPAPRPNEVFTGGKKRGPKRKLANDNFLVPLYGLAAGGVTGAHTMSTDVIDEIECPKGLIGVVGAYALRTNGESMIPRYYPGDILFVNPNQPVQTGDHVIIQIERFEGAGTETWVKRYDGVTDGTLLVWQYNPAARIEFSRKEVRYIHRIVPPNELHGL